MTWSLPLVNHSVLNPLTLATTNQEQWIRRGGGERHEAALDILSLLISDMDISCDGIEEAMKTNGVLDLPSPVSASLSDCPMDVKCRILSLHCNSLDILFLFVVIPPSDHSRHECPWADYICQFWLIEVAGALFLLLCLYCWTLFILFLKVFKMAQQIARGADKSHFER